MHHPPNIREDSTQSSRNEGRDISSPGLVSINTSLQETVRRIGTFSAVTFHLRNFIECEGSCSCVCHSRLHFQSPRLLNQVIRALFVGYAGLPLLSSKCDILTCSNQFSHSLRFSYTFPSWFLAKTVNIVAATAYTGEPAFGLVVRNRVEYNSENSHFQFARDGNIAGITHLLQTRRASPNDVALNGGQTALNASTLI